MTDELGQVGAAQKVRLTLKRDLNPVMSIEIGRYARDVWSCAAGCFVRKMR